MRHTSYIKKQAKRFCQETAGSVAIIFGVMAVPVVMGAGVAIDMVRSSDAKAELQWALDAGALAAASSGNLSDFEREEIAKQTFAANFDPADGIDAVPTISITDGEVTMSVDYEYPTAFMRIAGIKTVDIGSSVTVNLPESKKAEIALVLDYSGSMDQVTKGQHKYKVMRDAAIQMVDDMTEEGTSDRVKFGLVPFSHHVRVMMPGKYVVGADPNVDWTGCTQDRMYPHNLTDDVPELNDDETKWGQVHAPEHISDDCTQYEPNSLTVRPISDDRDAIVSQLEDMKPYAWTHIGLGFSFGWQLVAPNGLFGEVAPYDDDETMKVIVLLTDGRQTEPSFGPGGSRTVAHGESNLEELCTNAKAKNVTVVTVAFDLQHQATEDRLRNCSSDPDRFFFIADDGAELVSSFEEIKNQLQQAIYIAK